ncbi:MAG: hypothetical protein HC805_06095 [Alkalinema sp. RL_2_19]|nr:hypothetical protein [Alkalinema sp. RL_2_19]
MLPKPAATLPVVGPQTNPAPRGVVIPTESVVIQTAPVSRSANPSPYVISGQSVSGDGFVVPTR